MFLNNTMYFGMRSRLEHSELKWGDVELMKDSTGAEYLIHNERATKTRTGMTSDARSFMPKMFTSPDNPRCPVAAYKVFKSKRPEEMLRDEAPFYIGIAKEAAQNKGHWFIKQAMGKNTINQLMKMMCNEAGITGKKSNHSARKTLITNLVHAGVENTVITQLSGHKNVQSINNYSSASVTQQKQMSDIITGLSHVETNNSLINANASDMPDHDPYEIPDDNEDETLVHASQEIVEETLKTIENYETHEISVSKSGGDILAVRNTNPVYATLQDIKVRNVETKSCPNTFSSFLPSSVLNGATIHGNITLNFGNGTHNPSDVNTSSHRKTFKRLRLIDSDSDTD